MMGFWDGIHCLFVVLRWHDISHMVGLLACLKRAHTHSRLRPFVRDYPGEPVPER